METGGPELLFRLRARDTLTLYVFCGPSKLELLFCLAICPFDCPVHRPATSRKMEGCQNVNHMSADPHPLQTPQPW